MPMPISSRNNHYTSRIFNTVYDDDDDRNDDEDANSEFFN